MPFVDIREVSAENIWQRPSLRTKLGGNVTIMAKNKNSPRFRLLDRHQVYRLSAHTLHFIGR